MEDKWQIRQRILSAGLPSATRLVGVAILEFRNRATGACFPAHASIAAMCAMSVPTVKRAIVALRAAGLVETKRAGRSCSYSFPAPVPSLGYIGISSSTGDLSDSSTGDLSPGLAITPQSIFSPGVGENTEEEQ